MDLTEEDAAFYARLNCTVNSSVDVLMFVDQSDPGYLTQRYNHISILLVLAGFGVVLNASMIAILLKSALYRHSTLSILLLQLFAANLLVSVFCLLADGIWNITVQWLGGDFLCRIIKFCQMFSLYATNLILTGISIETCITVTFPLSKSSRAESQSRVKIISGFTWVVSSLCSVPQAVIFHAERAPICAKFYQCVTHGFYSSTDQELAYTMATLIVMCMVPLCVIIVCYLVISVAITKESRIAAGSPDSVVNLRMCPCQCHLEETSISMSSMQNTVMLCPGSTGQGKRMYRKTRQISLWMTFITAASFVICWVPYYVGMLGYLFHWSISSRTMTIIFCLGMSFSVVNPIIFGGFLLTRHSIWSNQQWHYTVRRPSIFSFICSTEHVPYFA
ncbi:gonadotropin-releasing hormone receptor-like [Paramacrobiotus metropolitanus]|uniref:gonadotropin-releasing hormone receptor-like n=1 Tax=Paramacrobiotus metropolitanus TaxID=2943436 RepID=UPI002445B94C|nr:gonadotropin-releasing hormone receptor-like [Paramacrobiotus metropolitanus]XP_055353605.1 gonadotropin-releasing hormone receptor-like [Paramacrobiotus metropolitanus]